MVRRNPVSFDPKSLEANPYYNGPLCVDFYGRLHPKHVVGRARFHNRTNSNTTVRRALLEQFDQKVNRDFYVRRFGVVAGNTAEGECYLQLDLFTDYDALEKEKRLQKALLEIRSRFGANAVLKETNYMESGTARERNGQIGGHRA